MDTVVQAAEVPVPAGQVPEGQAPEGQAPEVAVPEGQAPGVQTPPAAAIAAAEHALMRAAQSAAATSSSGHPGGEFLSFRLGAEEYGIEILKVQEIRSYTQPTRMANAPSYIKGVVNLRGVIVPIIDLRLKLALERAEYNEFTVVIVLSVAQHVVGIVVDSVRDVLRLDPSQIRPAPDFSAAVDEAFIVGIGTFKDNAAPPADSAETAANDRMLILVDIDRLIASSDIGVGSPTIH